MVNVAIRETHEDDYADSPPSMARSSLLERMGYLDARLIDITRAAKCSAGTFYTYFSSKEVPRPGHRARSAAEDR